MIKRFASHFIFLPGHGYLKQYVVGVEEGQVVSAFPLTEEIEGVEWFPGVIALLNNEDVSGSMISVEKSCSICFFRWCSVQDKSRIMLMGISRYFILDLSFRCNIFA